MLHQEDKPQDHLTPLSHDESGSSFSEGFSTSSDTAPADTKKESVVLTTKVLLELLVPDDKFSDKEIEIRGKLVLLKNQGFDPLKSLVEFPLNKMHKYTGRQKISCNILHAVCATSTTRFADILLEVFPALKNKEHFIKPTVAIPVTWPKTVFFTPILFATNFHHQPDTRMSNWLLEKNLFELGSGLICPLMLKDFKLAEKILLSAGETGLDLTWQWKANDDITQFDVAVQQKAVRLSVMLLQTKPETPCRLTKSGGNYGVWFANHGMSSTELLSELFNALIEVTDAQEYSARYSSLNDLPESFYQVLVYYKQELIDYILQLADGISLTARKQLLRVCLGSEMSELNPSDAMIHQLFCVPREGRIPHPDNKETRIFARSKSKAVDKLIKYYEKIKFVSEEKTLLDAAVAEGNINEVVKQLQNGTLSAEIKASHEYGAWLARSLPPQELVPALYAAVIATATSIEKLAEPFYLVLIYYKRELQDHLMQQAKSAASKTEGRQLLARCLKGYALFSEQKQNNDPPSLLSQLFIVPRDKRLPHPNNRGKRTGFQGTESSVLKELHTLYVELDKPAASASTWLRFLSKPAPIVTAEQFHEASLNGHDSDADSSPSKMNNS